MAYSVRNEVKKRQGGYSVRDALNQKKREEEQATRDSALGQFLEGLKRKEESAESALSSPATVREKETVAPLSGGKNFMPTDVVGKYQATHGDNAILSQDPRYKMRFTNVELEQQKREAADDAIDELLGRQQAAQREMEFFDSGEFKGPQYLAAEQIYNQIQQQIAEENKKAMSQQQIDEIEAFQEMERWQSVTGRKGFADASAYAKNDDLRYNVINRDPEAVAKSHEEAAKYNLDIAGVDMGHLEQMTDEEIGLYNYYYSTEGKEKADEYLASIESDLKARRMGDRREWYREYAEQNPVAASAFSVLTSPVRGLSYVGQAADYLKNGKMDANESYNIFTRAGSDIRGQVSSDIEKNVEGFWGKAGSFAYNTGMSMGDFLMAAGLSGGVGGIATTIMGTGAAAQTVLDAKDRGLNDDQAFALGTIAGFAEAATEKFSIEALLDRAAMGKGALTYILKNAITEGSEEAASGIINAVADILISKDKSEWAQSVEDYKAQGMSDKEAFWRAVADQAKSIGLDALGGMLSGGLIGSVGAIGNTAAQQAAQPKKGAEVATDMGIGKHGAEAAEKAGITPENVGAFTANYEAGKDGKAFEEVKTAQTGIDENVARQAYNAGQMDAIDNAAQTADNGVEQEAIANEEQRERESLRLRGSREWSDGQNPSGQPGGVVEGAGRDQSGNAAAGSATGTGNQRVYRAHQKSTTGALGIAGGSTKDTVYTVGADYSKETAQAKKLASERGLRTIFFTGNNLTIKGKQVRGYVSKDRVFVRADHPKYTPEQIMRHELGHDKISLGEINVDEVLERLDSIGMLEDATSIADAYAAAYESVGQRMTIDEIFEEMVCDALADMNDLTVDERSAAAMAKVKEAAQANYKSRTANAPKTTEQAARKLERKVGKELDVPAAKQKEKLRSIVETMAEQALSGGEISQDIRDELFETAYENGVKTDDEFYWEAKDVKEYLRSQAIKISEYDKHDIPDWNDFRKSCWGLLRISNKGLPVDVAYQEVQEMAPYLFPKDITAASDQLMHMRDVADRIRKTDKSLDEYYGSDAEAFKESARVAFDQDVDQFLNDLRKLQRKWSDDGKASTDFAANSQINEPMTIAEEKTNKQSLELSEEAVQAAMNKLIEKYGAIEPGENPFRTVQVPKKTSDTEKVSYTARTAMEAEATPADFVPLIENEIVKGGFSFVPVSNDETTKRAKGFILGEGWRSAWNKWSADVKMGKADNETIAIGALLYNHAVNAGDYKAALDILTDYQVAVRNSARGLQAARILKKLSPDARLYMINKDIQKLVEELKLDEPIELPPSLVDQYMKAKSNREIDNAVGDIQEYVAAQIPSTGIDMWTALRYTNMLGNFKTQVRNVAGNVGMRLVSEVENAAALAVEKLAGGKLGRTRALFVDKQLRQLAKEDFANVRSEAMGETRYTLDNATASSFLKGVQDKKTVFKRDIKVFGKDMTLPKVFNAAIVPMEYYRKATNWAMNNAKFGDEGFTKSAYARALGEYLKANGVTAEQFGSEEWQQKHGEFLDKARQYAVARAQELTFRDHNAFSNAIASMGRKPTSGKWTKVLSEGVLPFRRTPANVLVRAEEYSPLGLINTAIKAAQLAKGKENVTGNDVVNSLAKTITGTGIFLVGMAMHNMGLLRGGDDEDEKVARMDDLMGHQTYALEIGGVSYTLDWLTPTAMPLFMGAQLNNLIEDGGFELKDIYGAIVSLADPMLQMSMLSGLNDTLDNIRYIQGNGLLQIALNAGIDYLTQGLTNSLMGQLDRTLKDVSEMTFTDSQGDLPTFLQKELGAASRKVPVWDYSQIPYIDAWGRTESNGSVPGRILKNFLSPGYVSEIGGGDLEDEILELYQLTGDGGVFPGTADKHFPVKGEEVYLNADEYVQYATEKGQLSYEIAEKIMKSSVYRGMSDEEKANAISDAYALANVIAKKSVSKYETEGWKEKAVAAKKIGIDYSKYLEVRLTVKDIESLKDKDGKSINGSKSLQIMEAIYNIKGLNDKQRLQLFEDFDVGESYWKDTVPLNKSAVEAKLKNMR